MWLPMLLLAVMASGSACPDFCQCRSPVLECSDHVPNFTQLEELPSSFTELVLHRVFEKGLPPYMEAMLNSRIHLRLEALEVTNRELLTRYMLITGEKLLQLPPDNHDGSILPNVRSLNISHKQLKNFPMLPYEAVSQLRVLDVGHNRIAKILSKDFEGMYQLTWLNLAGNELDYIRPTCFRFLKSLEYLDLSDNVLYTLEGVFDKLQTLQRLNVAGNKLEHVQANWFQNLGRLVELDISRNKLTFIPADTLQPLASLSVFKLAENPLIERDLSLLLGTGRRLEIVDASRIGLVRVPAALTRSVRTLKLAGNQLTSINSGDLDSYPLLRSLDLSNNRLMIIEEDALGRLDGLEELILSGNILPIIPKSLPSGLKIFDLRQNAISKLKANDLQGLYLLKELNLSGNVISIIEGGSFRQLPALETLDISDNPIKKLPSDTLSGPTNLVTLRMSGLMSLETEENQNQDTAFPILTPERLVTLDVSRSPALAAQLLADNAALSACKSLQALDLSYTNTSAMRSDLAYVLPQLQKLNLIGNEWNCSADQFWLGEWIRQHNKTSSKFTTRCSTPSNLEGTLLEALPAMPNNQMTTTKVVVVEEETNTTTSKTPELKYSTVIHENVSKSESTGIKELESSTEWPSKPKAVTTIYHTTENLLFTTGVQKIISAISTTRPSITTKSPLTNQDSIKESIAEQNKSRISASITYGSDKTITATTEEEWSNFSTASEEYTSSVINYEPTKVSGQSTTPIDFIMNDRVKEPDSTTLNLEHTYETTSDDKKVTKDISMITPTSHDTESTAAETTTITTTTTKIPSTVSFTSANIDVTSTTKVSFLKPKQPALIKIEESVPKKFTHIKEDVEIQDKKSLNRVVSEFSRSKLVLANEESRVNDEPNSFAEELNSQATESGARTSESLATGAHPGMLVLLGAAIGAAAALTVVLSRRATVKRRDRQYQRHENIEVHALTPTTELW